MLEEHQEEEPTAKIGTGNSFSHFCIGKNSFTQLGFSFPRFQHYLSSRQLTRYLTQRRIILVPTDSNMIYRIDFIEQIYLFR